MTVARSIADMRAQRARLKQPIGFVPTMGALHAGHLSLVARARAECASTVVSIFVNPLQFGRGEDFDRYPRTLDADVAALENHGVDVVFAPEHDEMYRHGTVTFVEPSTIAAYLEGERRPGHFRGVATVVAKLFNIVAPQRAYFGRKDAQQLAVVERMASDLDMPVEIVGCETVREADGLALSSRNAYLSAEQRAAATHLSAALRAIVEEVRQGRHDARAIIAAARQLLPPLREDYLAIVDPTAFVPVEDIPAATRLLAVGAAFAGSTRLIDNMEVFAPARTLTV